MITPIQRIPRYELLLNELIKRTAKINEKHKDLEMLQQALQQITEINKLINDRIKQYEKRERVKSIANKFDKDTLNMEIIIPSRYFIMDNDQQIITKHDKFGKTLNIYMVLFNDGILYSHPKSLPNLYRSSTMYIFDNFLPFNITFEIQNIGQLYKNLHCLKILSSTESIWISFESESYKQQWIMNISTALNIQLAKDQNIQKSISNELIQCVCLIPDDFTNQCMECDTDFSITTRRHHCYNSRCGKLICHQCSDFQILNPQSTNNTIRVCKSCYIHHQQSCTEHSFIQNIMKDNIHIIMIFIILCIIFQQQLYNVCITLLFPN